MTIKDIAAIAGVSATTVSMVLNNKAESISEETREKVLRIAKEYNFKPYAKVLQNAAAPSGLLGLLIPGTAGDFSGFIAGAQEAAAAEGYSVILCSAQDEQAAKKHLSGLFGRGVDGVGLYLPGEMELDSLFSGAPERLVYAAATHCSSTEKRCAAFCSFSEAARLAAEHLLTYGHRQIALLGWQGHALAGELTSGYGEALRRRDVTLRDEAVCLCASVEDAAGYVRQLIYGRNTAFLCQDAQIAACVYRTLSHYSLQIPKDYSVMSVSDACALDVFAPRLTAVDLRFREMGQSVVRTLIARIEGVVKKPPEPRQLQPRLRQGGSVTPPMKNMGKRIVVVGSMNMDTIIRMPHIPTSGESLLSQRISNYPGGKGANQAVGIARLKGDAYAIGCMGLDVEGRQIYNNLIESGVNTAGIRSVHDKPTGKAYILAAENGESTIVLSNGANGYLLPSVVEKSASSFEGAEFCLLSTEIPWETVLYTIELCARNQVKVILKPTVPESIAPDVLDRITYLILNEKELELQIAEALPVEEKAARLSGRGARNVIVTLGDRGCYLHSPELKRFFPAADFPAVDATGAGDAFISALAVYLSEGHGIVPSIKFATYAAGLSVTRDGVQPALAERIALDIYAEQIDAT